MDPYDNPFTTHTGRGNRSGGALPMTEDDFRMPGGARSISRQLDAAEGIDPVAEQMKNLTQQKTFIGQAKKAAENLRDEFLNTDGADLFEKDPTTNKALQNADGSYMPRLGAEIDALRKQSEQKVGFIRGALTPAVAGDSTDESYQAKAKLAQLEPVYKAKMDKWQRIQDRIAEYDAAHKDTENQLGAYAAQRLSGRGVLGAPMAAQQPGVPVANTGAQPVQAPAPAQVQPAGQQAQIPAAPAGQQGTQPAALAPAGPTPAELVRIHKQMKDAETVAAMDTTNPNLKTALAQKRERLQDQFVKGMAGLVSDGMRQRVMDAVRDPTMGEYVKNFMGRLSEGAGSGLVDMGEFAIRNTAGFVMGEDSNKFVAELSQGMRDEAASWGLKGVPKEVAEKLQESFSGMIAQGLGSTASFMVPTAGALRIGKAMGASTKLLAVMAAVIPGIAGGAQSGNSMRRDATVSFEQMVRDGEITPEEAQKGIRQAELIGALVIGPTESLSPMGRWAKRMAGIPAGQNLLKQMAQKMGDGGLKTLVQWLRGNGRRLVADALAEGGEEMMQELTQSYLENRTARGDLGNVAYDPNRDIGEGLAESAGSAGIVGSLVSALLGGYSGGNVKRQRRISEAIKRGNEAGYGKPAQDQAKVDELNADVQEKIAKIDAEKPKVPVAEPQKTPTDEGAPQQVEWTFTGKDGSKQTVVGTGLKDAVSKLPEGFDPDLSKAPEQSPITPGPESGASSAQPGTSVETPSAPAPTPESVVNTPETLAGDKINKEWTAFSTESQTLGVPRAEMPQVKAEHRGALTNFLKGKDIMSEDTEVLPTELKPTQAEFSQAKVDKARKFEGGDRAILVSSDNYVVDGHHQWMAKLNDAPDEYMRVIKLDAPISELLDVVKQFPSAQAAAGSTNTKPISQPKPESGPKGATKNPQTSAPAGNSSVKAPAIARGSNTADHFAATISKSAGLKQGSAEHRVVAGFSQKMAKFNVKAFRDMEVHTLSQKEWDSHKVLGKHTPDSAGAYDADSNTLYLNTDKSSGKEIVNTLVHEAGHFAEKFALGEAFTQREWEKLTPAQREEAIMQYAPRPNRPRSEMKLDKNDKRARAEWVAMQFARVVRGDTEQMSKGMVAKLQAWLNEVRGLVNKWIGDGKLTTKELDAKILEILGYAEGTAEQKNPQKGDSMTLMQTNGTVKDVQVIGGVEYLLLRGEKDGGVIRVTDLDSGETVSIKKHPSFAPASAEYYNTIQKAEQAQKPVPAPAKKPSKFKVSDDLREAGDELFGTPATGDGYSKKFGIKIPQANNVIGMIVRDNPEINSRQLLAEFIASEFPKAKPYSESLFSILSGAIEVDSTGSANDWEQIYAKIEGGETAGDDTATRIRALITSEDSHSQKHHQMNKLAGELGITLKDMQEMVEAELVKMVHEIATGSAEDSAKFKQALEIYNKQPLFSARTSTSVENQAYSTPAPLALALRHITGVTTGTAMYEPTAGTGMLMAGTNLEASQANELNDIRRNALEGLGVGKITDKDATEYVPNRKFDVVHANPPFGSISNVNYDGFGIRKLEHLISLKALEAMKDDGTAALILGANMNPGPISKGAQWVFENYLYGHYNVVDNFEVSGDLYANQGAKWPVRVLVIAGRRSEVLTGELAPNEVDRLDNWDDVWKRSKEARNEVEQNRIRLGTEKPTGTVTGSEKGPTRPEKPGNISDGSGGNADTTGQGGRSGRSGRGKSPDTGESDGRGTSVAPTGTTGRPQDATGTNEKPGVTGEQSPQLEADNSGNTDERSGTDAAGGSETTSGRNKLRVLPESVAVNDRQSTYVPRAEGNPFETLTPSAIADKEHAALDKMEKKVGPLSEYVADKINLPIERVKAVLAADQIDGVAQAIYQIETGGALVIGDETGIGKGRQAAAVIRYAITQGKIPVFFTKDPKLFSDMYADLKDIDTTVKPLIFGDQKKATIKNSDDEILIKAPNSAQEKRHIKAVSENGMEKAGFDAIFITYSQINERNQRQEFLEKLATKNDVVVILDEAHEASGDGDTSMQAAFMRGGLIKRGKGSEKRQIPVPGLLNKPGTKKGRGGVLYLSATFAKRPNNTPLYFRTALSKAAKGFQELVTAMEKGGVALQQAVSEALAAAGQYIRRERDFTGVSYTQREVGTERAEELKRQVDDVTEALRAIIEFSSDASEHVAEVAGGKATAMSEAQIDVTEFAAVVHNNVSQLLLAAKADAVVEYALDLHRKGEKPVITLMNTMESFLDQFVDDKDIKPGEKINVSWKDMLKHALSRTLRASIKQPNGDTEIVTVTPEEIGMEDEYQAIVEAIDELDVPFPSSPIDYIIQRLRSEGVKIGELTGRTSGVEYTNAEGGEGTYKHFKKADKNSLVNGFNSGELDALLLNASGSTGLSLHASTRFKDQKKRHMIIAQPALDINVFVQTLGRIKRTGMVPGSAEYTHIKLPLQAEIRPAVITNRKMRSLNANTSAEADGVVNLDSADILNKYGDQIVTEYLDGDLDLQQRLGLWVESNERTGALKVDEDIAKKFTGRISLIPDAEQERIYGDIIPAYNNLIEQLRQTGEYDLDIVVHDDWDGVLGSDTELQAGTDEGSIFTASVRAQQWEITDKRPIPTGKEMLAEFASNHGSREQFDGQWREFRGKVNTQVINDIAEANAAVAKAEAMEDGLPKRAELQRASQKQNHANKMKDAWERVETGLDRVFDKIGQPVELHSTGQSAQSWEGMLVGVKFPKAEPNGRLRYAASRFQLRFLVNEPGGRHYLAGSAFLSGSHELVRTTMTADDFKGSREASNRYRRWVITGNPIAAYTATGGHGKMIRFKSRDNEVITGLLMRQNWSIDKLPSDPRYKLVSGTAVQRFLTNQTGNYRLGVFTGPLGVIRIQPDRGYYSYGFEVQTPSSSKGKDYYLDPQLRAIVGDFRKTGSRMVAVVRKDDIAKVAERIAKIAQQDFRADGNGPDVIKSVSESNNPKQGPLGTPAVKGTAAQEEIMSKVNGTLEDKRSLKEKFDDMLAWTGEKIRTTLQQKLVDRFNAIKRLERAVFGTNDIDAAVSAYKWTRLTGNLAGVMEYMMKHGTIAYKSGSMVMNKGTKGLIDILEPVVNSGKLHLWEGYVTAYRAKQLLAEGREKNFGKFKDPQTGEWAWDRQKAEDEINTLLELGKDHPEFEQVRKEYVEFQKSVLDLATAAGLINPEKRAMWERSDYVPFYRIVDALDKKDTLGPKNKRGIAGQRSGIRRLKGAPQQVAIIENIYRNIEQLVDASFKNIAMQRVADLADQNTDMIIKIPYKAIPFKTTVEETIERLEKAGVDTSALTPDELNEVVTFWRMRAPEGKDIVSMMHNGKPVYYRVKDKPLLNSILAIGPQQHALWMKMLMAPKHVLTSLVTLDPAFMAANTVRDSFSAWVIADTPIKPGWDSMRGFVKSLMNDPVKLGIMVNGGGTGHYNTIKESEVRTAFLRMTKEQKTDFLGSIIDSPAKIWRIYKDLGRASENANRIAIAESASKRGASPAESAFQALDIMDFGLRGDSKLLNFFLDTVPFMNARIQGLYRLGRGLMNDPKRVATHGAIIIGGTLALLASNWDDDRYWELPEWDRDLYYHIWLGGRHIRIPKPFEVGQMFSTIPERFAQYVAKDGDSRIFARRMLSMIGDTLAMNPIPQVLKPLAERATNLNMLTWGKIISRGDEYKTPEQQYNAYTSVTARELADSMPDNAPEWARSPKTLDFLIRGYFGTIGMYALDVSDALVRTAGEYPERPASKLGDYWMMKRFAPESDLKENKYVSELYSLNEDVSLLISRAKALQERGDFEEANKILAANREAINYSPVLKATENAMASLRKQEQDIYANPRGKTPEQRREELARIKAQKNRLARQAVTRRPNRPQPIYNPFSVP